MKDHREGFLDCPEHELPMYYNAPSKLYACQNSKCKYAGGVSKLDVYKDLMWPDREKEVNGDTIPTVQE